MNLRRWAVKIETGRKQLSSPKTKALETQMSVINEFHQHISDEYLLGLALSEYCHARHQFRPSDGLRK
jgi:hypothetical protein